MSTITRAPAETRTLLTEISWATFVAICEERPGSVPRLTYDRGTLELMSPLRQHENIGRLIGRMVETFTEVHEIEIQSVASTTFKRSDLSRGFEGDESYHIEHAELVRKKWEVDLATDPPPDLVIEVEITKSAIDKPKLFAAMEIPEYWHFKGEQIRMFSLRDGGYVAVDESVLLPGMSRASAQDVLDRRFEMGETRSIRRYRQSLERS